MPKGLFDRKEIVGNFVVFDIETTGLSPEKDDILEVCVLRTNGRTVNDKFHSLIHTDKKITAEITCINGIKNSDLTNAPLCSDILNQVYFKYNSCIFVAHNCFGFDAKFLISKKPLLYSNINYIDTRQIAKDLFPGLKSLKNYTQGTLCNLLGIHNRKEHSAHGDADALMSMFQIFLKMLDFDVSKYVKNGTRIYKPKESIDL